MHLDKQNTPRRSEQSAKEVTQSEKVKVHHEAFGVKRKRMTKNGAETTTSTSPQSTKCKKYSLLGTCVLCSKEKRICYYSQEKELCTCDAKAQKNLDQSSTRKDGVDQGASQMDDHGTVCAVCNNDGELLCCEGKDCKIRYHLSCLDPCLPNDLPGARHCPKCVKKKLTLGVHSVSEGVESTWDVRVVVISKAKGRQVQYLVKYHGLAHIHNHWVPLKQLLLKYNSLVWSFIDKEETAGWNVDWTVPHRLLRKRPILDKLHTAFSADVSERYEWLVKWKGLDYDHATWELDSSQFLNSSLGQDLMTDYALRREKAKREVDKSQKGSVEILELPASEVNVKDNFLLKNVNKLRDCWCKSQNTIVFDNQDRAMTLVFFIRSLAEICHPFLIIAASDSLSQWEGEFARLAPSVDVVVYNGNADTRKRISASEFYEEGGCVMLQVLLSSPEAVFEDMDTLSCIRWQSVVIDEYHEHSQKSIDLEQIKNLTTNSRILLLSGQIKDTTSEYLNILSLVDSEHEYNKLRGLRCVKNDNLAKLKERLSQFIAYGSTSKVSKFLECWVPIQISNHQLEQYCATLISNSTLLCSYSRKEKFGAHRDILLTLQKCCDHPYLVDSPTKESMIAEKSPAAEVLSAGIKASGKLQFLEMMLTKVKARGLQALILFQTVGSGGISAADILDDVLAQKFGQSSYERVQVGYSPASRQAAVERFNKKQNGQFVLLLEKNACSSTIKISSLDVIILFNSDWNPENDIRALHKLSIDSSAEQIKVFRLYSSCTVEERSLVIAKKHLYLDNNLQASASRAPSDSVLMWCASYLLNKLDDYHSERFSEFNIKSGPSLLNEITEEVESVLSGRGDMSKRFRIISMVKLMVGSYSADVPLLGEAKAQLIDVEEPHVFWKKLLESPRWKHIMRQSPRNQKRVHYLDGSLVRSDTENDDSVKKHRGALIEDVYQAAAPAPVEVQEHQATRVAGSKEGTSRIVASSSSQSPLNVRDDISGKAKSMWSLKMLQYINCRLRVTTQGGHQLIGKLLAILRNFNLVLGDCEEFRTLPPTEGSEEEREVRRTIGLVLLRRGQVFSLIVEPPLPPDDNCLGTTASSAIAGPGLGRAAGQCVAASQLAQAQPGLVGGPSPGMMQPPPPMMRGPPPPGWPPRPGMLGPPGKQPPRPGVMPPPRQGMPPPPRKGMPPLPPGIWEMAPPPPNAPQNQQQKEMRAL